MSIIDINPIIVVNKPNFFDLVHPNKEIIRTIEIIPIKKENIPTVLGKIKSSLFIGNGYPSVVFIVILVIAMIEIKKELVAITDTMKIFVIILSEYFLSISKTNTVKLKPANNVLININ